MEKAQTFMKQIQQLHGISKTCGSFNSTSLASRTFELFHQKSFENEENIKLQTFI